MTQPDGGRPVAPGPEADSGDAWRRALESLDDAFLVVNDDQVVLYASPAVADLLGVAPADLVGRSPDFLMHEDDLAQVWQTRADVRASGAVRARGRAVRPDGSVVHVEGVLRRVDDPVRGSGTVTFVQVRDVSDRLLLQSEMARLHHRYRTLMTATSEGVIVADRNYRVADLNERAAELLGWPADKLLGQSPYELLDIWDEDGRPLVSPSSALRLTLTAGPDTRGWRSVRRQDGSRVPLRMHATTVPGPGEGLVVTLQSVHGGPTATSRAEAERARRIAIGLSPREGEVLELLAGGLDISTIGARLGISDNTVRGVVKRLLAKLGVHSQLQAVVAAVRAGIVTVPGSGTGHRDHTNAPPGG